MLSGTALSPRYVTFPISKWCMEIPQILNLIYLTSWKTTMVFKLHVKSMEISKGVVNEQWPSSTNTSKCYKSFNTVRVTSLVSSDTFKIFMAVTYNINKFESFISPQCRFNRIIRAVCKEGTVYSFAIEDTQALASPESIKRDLAAFVKIWNSLISARCNPFIPPIVAYF